MQSFAPQPTTNTSNCYYCGNHFDAAQRSPYIICNNNHRICQQCLNSLQNPANCKVCRLPIDFTKIRPNRELVQILTSSKTLSHVQQPQKVINQQINQVSANNVSNENRNAKVAAYSLNNDINAVKGQVQNYPPIPTPANQNNNPYNNGGYGSSPNKINSGPQNNVVPGYYNDPFKVPNGPDFNNYGKQGMAYNHATHHGPCANCCACIGAICLACCACCVVDCCLCCIK